LVLASPTAAKRSCLSGEALCENGEAFLGESLSLLLRRASPYQKPPRIRLVGRDSVEPERSLSSFATVLSRLTFGMTYL